MTKEEYRKIVSAIVINKKKQVLMCEHVWIDDAWQFPQGGIEKGESPKETILRELNEELAMKKLKIIEEMSKKIKYYFPHYLKEKYNCSGNEQTFFLLYYYGDESEIRFDNQQRPEFKSYKWVNYDQPPKQVIYFKKISYYQALKHFKKAVEKLDLTQLEQEITSK